MEFYIITGTLIAIITAYPFIRLFLKRLSLYRKITRKKEYILETNFINFFSPLRISEGFTLYNKITKNRIKIYIVSAYNRRETVKFSNTEYCIKKLFLMMGGRIGACAKFTWETPTKNIPEYILKETENSYLLLSPVPLAVEYNGKEIYLGDRIYGKEILSASKLLKKL